MHGWWRSFLDAFRMQWRLYFNLLKQANVENVVAFHCAGPNKFGAYFWVLFSTHFRRCEHNSKILEMLLTEESSGFLDYTKI
eukprot:scaffold180343_cov17-Tisochrysis_lutea.AAC.1